VLSYRHAFHAGNFADVVKHVGLVEILEALARKPAPFFVLDTHAGAGLYHLTVPPASTPWSGGLGFTSASSSVLVDVQ